MQGLVGWLRIAILDGAPGKKNLRIFTRVNSPSRYGWGGGRWGDLGSPYSSAGVWHHMYFFLGCDAAGMPGVYWHKVGTRYPLLLSAMKGLLLYTRPWETVQDFLLFSDDFMIGD